MTVLDSTGFAILALSLFQRLQQSIRLRAVRQVEQAVGEEVRVGVDDHPSPAIRRSMRSTSTADGGTNPAARKRWRSRCRRSTRLSTCAVRDGSGISVFREDDRPSRVRMHTVPCRSHAASTFAGWRFRSRTVNDRAADELDLDFGVFDFDAGFMSDMDRHSSTRQSVPNHSVFSTPIPPSSQAKRSTDPSSSGSFRCAVARADRSSSQPASSQVLYGSWPASPA
jgi:hypothetical protein